MSKTINYSEVENFIKTELHSKLRKYLLNINIIKESDLECCIYYHMRRFLHYDKQWRVLTRKFVPHTGCYPDIILFNKTTPKIGMELKWNEKNIGRKDMKSLNKLLKIGVNKVFYINILKDKKYEKQEKNLLEKNRYFDVIVNLGLQGNELKKWKDDRELFRSKMKKGTSKKYLRIIDNRRLLEL